MQVSVSWNSNADVDLYVVEPAGGEEIYYGDQQSAAGGSLDLDSNAACSGDNVRNENITYPNSALRGTYTVRVNLWADCGAASTDYVVTIRRQDQPPLTRRERAEHVRKRDVFTKYGPQARAVLEALLQKYQDEGVTDLDDPRILQIRPFDAMGTPVELIRRFGTRRDFERAVAELQSALYQGVA